MIYKTHPFLLKDGLASAIPVAANEALLEMACALRPLSGEQAEISAWISRGRRGLANSWDSNLGLCLDLEDLRANAPLRVRTVAGFLRSSRAALGTSASCSKPSIPEPSSGTRSYAGLSRRTSPLEGRFHLRSYWRGPVWPVISWLLWWPLSRAGDGQRVENLRRVSLKAFAEGEFAEYFEPFTGEPLGSDDQSWTAAVTLDCLADGADARDERSHARKSAPGKRGALHVDLGSMAR